MLSVLIGGETDHATEEEVLETEDLETEDLGAKTEKEDLDQETEDDLGNLEAETDPESHLTPSVYLFATAISLLKEAWASFASIAVKKAIWPETVLSLTSAKKTGMFNFSYSKIGVQGTLKRSVIIVVRSATLPETVLIQIRG